MKTTPLSKTEMVDEIIRLHTDRELTDLQYRTQLYFLPPGELEVYYDCIKAEFCPIAARVAGIKRIIDASESLLVTLVKFPDESLQETRRMVEATMVRLKAELQKTA